MNFEELGKKLKKISQDTVTEVQKMNEIRQLNSRVNEEKKKLNAIYMEIGKKIYELYKDVPLEGFEAEIRSIEEKFSMIDLLQDQIRNVKGVVLCPCCNTEINVAERFCSNCGSRMPEIFTIEDKEEAEVIEDAEVVEEVEEAAEIAEETAEEAAEVVEETAEEAAEVVEETAEEVEETAEEVEETAEAVEEAAAEVTAEENAEDVKEEA